MADIQEETGSVETNDGHTLFYRKWVPGEEERLRVIVSHGLGEHSGRYGHVAECLCPLGASVWIQDHRGHGRSQGKRGHVRQFIDYVYDLRSFVRLAATNGAQRRPTLLLGHSMGGLIALSLIRQFPQHICGLITSSPLLGIHPQPAALRALVRILSAVWPSLTIKNRLDPTLISHDEAQVAAYRQDDQVHDAISTRWFTECMAEIERTLQTPQAVRLPILMQVAGADQLVDPKATLDYFESLSVENKTLCHYETLYHEVYNEKQPEREKVLTDLKNWVTTNFLSS